MRGYVGFQRELVQHRFAEGVDGLDLQPARRLQRLGETAFALGAAWRRSGCRPSSSTMRLRQLFVAEHRPLRQAGEDAVRHVGGGGARIGQAEDLRRVGALQQQADDALRQHMRLARPGIGRHPDGILRDRRRAPAGPPCRRAPYSGASSFVALAGAARRPFEHAREMVVVAVDLRLAERQRPRQIAGAADRDSGAAAFRAAPRPLRTGRTALFDLRSCSRIDSCNTSPFAFSLMKARSAGSSGPDILERAAPQQRAFQRELRRKQRVRLGLGRRRPGLVVEDVGQAFPQDVDAIGIARQRDLRAPPTVVDAARASAARRVTFSARSRSQATISAASSWKRGHHTASTSGGSAALGKTLLALRQQHIQRRRVSRIGSGRGKAMQDRVEQRAALGRARIAQQRVERPQASGCAAHRSRRGRGAASRSRSPRNGPGARRAAALAAAAPRISPAGPHPAHAPRRATAGRGPALPRLPPCRRRSSAAAASATARPARRPRGPSASG